MAGRSPARLLAPLALVAVCVALYAVVTASDSDPTTERPGSGESRRASERQAGDGARRARSRRPRRYTVRSGDTLSSIAERFDVSTSEIEDLNPDVDPQLLAPGTRIRIPR